MKYTKSTRTALNRMVDATPDGWTCEKVRGGYKLDIGDADYHVRAVAPTLASIVDVAMSPIEAGGLGWSEQRVQEEIMWNPRVTPKSKTSAHHREILERVRS